MDSVKRRLTLRSLLRLTGGALLLLLLALGAAYVVNGDVRYVVRVGVEEAGILMRRRPITEVAADSTTDPATRSKLLLVLAAREFAAESLGLDPAGAYETFSRVNRDTLVLLLSASRNDRLAPYTWRYPVVGRVPYKGFFSFERAAREARQLERAGLDTYIRVANAYSTLGWFEDPLLSTVLREDSMELVATVLHEITHNTVFVPGHVDFNESFANLVGYRGAERFFRSRGDRRNAERSAARWRDEIRLGRFYANLVEQLERLYAPGIAGPQLREARIELFRQALARLAGGLERSLEVVDGVRLSERPLNNAVVLAQRVYRTNLDQLERMVQRRGGLGAAVEYVRQQAAAGGDPWAWVR